MIHTEDDHDDRCGFGDADHGHAGKDDRNTGCGGDGPDQDDGDDDCLIMVCVGAK